MIRALLEDPDAAAIADPEDDAALPAPSHTDVIGVRRLLIGLAQLDAEAKRVKDLRDEVAATYNARLDRIDRRRETLRSWLAVWVHLNGKVSFPDVGGAHLAKRKATLRVVDEAAALSHAVQVELEAGVELTSRSLVKSAYKAYASELLEATGEVMPGCQREPESEALVVRSA